MRTLIAAAFALALTGGAASAQYYTNGAPVFLYQQAQMPSSFPDSATIADFASGAALQRNQMNELRLQMMREQLRQMRQR
jgi:hypothetical protein